MLNAVADPKRSQNTPNIDRRRQRAEADRRDSTSRTPRRARPSARRRRRARAPTLGEPEVDAVRRRTAPTRATPASRGAKAKYTDRVHAPTRRRASAAAPCGRTARRPACSTSLFTHVEQRPEDRRQRDRHAELLRAQQQERVGRIAEREEEDHGEERPEARAHAARELDLRLSASAAPSSLDFSNADERRRSRRSRPGIAASQNTVRSRRAPPRQQRERDQRPEQRAGVVRRAAESRTRVRGRSGRPSRRSARRAASCEFPSRRDRSTRINSTCVADCAIATSGRTTDASA